MSDMTPQQAADELAQGFPGRALRVLIDHARAAAPEGGDLAAVARGIEDARRFGETGSRTTPIDKGLLRSWAAVVRAHRCAPSVAAPPREDDLLAALASTWDENAAEERRILRSPNVTVEEAHSCEPVARAWSEAASDLRDALAASGTVRDPERPPGGDTR